MEFGVYVRELEEAGPENPGQVASEFTVHAYEGLANPTAFAVRVIGCPTMTFDTVFGEMATELACATGKSPPIPRSKSPTKMRILLFIKTPGHKARDTAHDAFQLQG